MNDVFYYMGWTSKINKPGEAVQAINPRTSLDGFSQKKAVHRRRMNCFLSTEKNKRC